MLLDLLSFAGAADNEVVDTIASVSRFNFRFEQVDRIGCFVHLVRNRPQQRSVRSLVAYGRGCTAWMEGQEG